MAPTVKAHFFSIFTLLLLAGLSHYADGDCTFPSFYTGDWFSMEGEDGVSVRTLVSQRKWGNLDCIDDHYHEKPVKSVLGQNATFLLAAPGGADSQARCYYCQSVLWRTPNVLQVFRSEPDCNTGSKTNVSIACRPLVLPSIDRVVTYFKTTDEVNVNCISTFEGVYQFTYEVRVGGGGICDNQESMIRACQDPGSAYVDNQVFRMQFAKCRDVSTSYNQQIRYQCYGTWYAMRCSGRNCVGYTYAAISDTVEKDNRERFKCLMTLKNQKDKQNKIRWVMSRFADCSNLNSIYDGPVRLVLTRIPPPTDFLTPKCSLPRNITGTWLTQGVQYRSDIRINDTHIYYFTPINEFEYQETYYSCQQSQGTRYLMTKVVVGRCEVDFTCFDIIPRHHSIVRYRVGMPYQLLLNTEETNPKDYMERAFREACSWRSFTFNRDEYKWKYEVMIQNPPSPVPCPIAGRYSFIQRTVMDQSRPYQVFSTRIRGVTEKPRVQVDCRNWVTEFKSCSDTMTRIDIDSEYCESVNYRGRPIGEYDEPDNYLSCVGFWMEDMKSYLITWDEENAVSSFRCWVYERKSWTGVYMSRAQNARCPFAQDSQSYALPGTGLALDLTESERLFDDCPQRFDPGSNPYSKPITLWVLSAAGTPLPSLLGILLISIATMLICLH